MNPETIAFAGSAQRLLDIADAIHGIRRNPGERHGRRQCTADHLNRQRRLGGKGYTASTVWADSACRSKEAEKKLAARGFTSRIHRRGCRNTPLTARQEAANKTRSSVRARVEHVFGSQHTSMGGKLVRTIGIVRASMNKTG